MRIFKLAGILIILCILGIVYLSPKRSHLSVCAIFKNEAPWLTEWLNYHHKVLGVSHFYLYNNDSSDQYEEVLKPYIDRGVVELIEWGSEDPSHATVGAYMDAPWSSFQLGAYNDCLKNRALGKTHWVAMIDIDEFIVPLKGVRAFYDLLRTAERKGKGSIQLFWRVFGTSDIANLQKGERLTEKLIWRSQDDHPWNRHVKSIHRPEAVAFCLVHEAEKFKPPYKKKIIPREEACIHHYWSRTEQFCLDKRGISKDSNPEFFEALHQIQDKTMLKLKPATPKY